MDSLPETDIEFGSIVSVGFPTNGVRDPILYQQHIKPQIYVPIPMTDAAPISSSLRFKIAYRKAVVAADAPVRPEIRWQVDPEAPSTCQVGLAGCRRLAVGIRVYCQLALQISAQIWNFWVLEALCAAAVT